MRLPRVPSTPLPEFDGVTVEQALAYCRNTYGQLGWDQLLRQLHSCDDPACNDEVPHLRYEPWDGVERRHS